MGNYFSSQKEESIKIINEIDHVHVIVTKSDLKNEMDETSGVKDETIQDTLNNVEVNEKKTELIDIDTKYHDKNNKFLQLNETFNDFNALNDVIFKKNLKKNKCKKNKCKKNKKKHLQ
jgi:hypothetical protein